MRMGKGNSTGAATTHAGVMEALKREIMKTSGAEGRRLGAQWGGGGGHR